MDYKQVKEGILVKESSGRIGRVKSFTKNKIVLKMSHSTLTLTRNEDVSVEDFYTEIEPYVEPTLLKDFVGKFVEHNTLFRLLYKNKSGHEIVLNDWNDVSMEHELLKGKGKFAQFADHEVCGVTDVLIRHGHCTEAVNIVI